MVDGSVPVGLVLGSPEFVPLLEEVDTRVTPLDSVTGAEGVPV